VVVRTAADAEPEHEPAAGHPVERGDLLGEQRGLPQRAEQHLGLQPDAAGRAGQHREGGQRFGIVEGEPVQQRQGVEPARLGGAGPVEESFGRADGQAKAEFHVISPYVGSDN